MAQRSEPAGDSFSFGDEVFILEGQGAEKGLAGFDIAQSCPILCAEAAVAEDIQRACAVFPSLFAISGA